MLKKVVMTSELKVEQSLELSQGVQTNSVGWHHKIFTDDSCYVFVHYDSVIITNIHILHLPFKYFLCGCLELTWRTYIAI